jgi:ppGpp synthetase/RelA/SpoT-type nucleotidyltranferase
MSAPEPSPGSSQWHRALVAEFHRLRPTLTTATQQLEQFLQRLAGTAAKGARVHVRTKSLLSFAEKIVRSGKAARHPRPLDPDRGLTDLIGGQIVTYSRRDMAAVCEQLRELALPRRGVVPLEIDPSASEDTIQRLGPAEFGYTARHFIVRFRASKLLGVDVSACRRLDHRLEIQVSHALAHAWNVITHDRTYKSDLQMPTELKRQVAEAKAMLDAAERQMELAVVELDRYRRRHAGRLWVQERIEWDRASMVADSVREVLAAGSRGKRPVADADYLDAIATGSELRAAAGRWREVAAMLKPVREQRPAFAMLLAQAHMELGQYAIGRRRLAEILRRQPTEPRAALMLAKEWGRRGDFRRALAVIEPAFAARPDEPELLATIVTTRLLVDGDARPLAELGGAIATAMAECQKRFLLGSDVPACLEVQFRLAILAGDPFAAVEFGCLAFRNGWSAAERAGERTQLAALAQRLRPAGRSGRDARERACATGLRVALECGIALLDLMAERDGGAEAKPLASRSFAPRWAVSREGRPVVWLAGGCDTAFERPVRQRRTMVLRAFDRFQGLLLGGGTRHGISGLVGDLADAARRARPRRRLQAIGYLPPRRSLPRGIRVDRRYHQLVEVRPAVGDEPLFSPLGPIRTWRDLLAAGVDPAKVRLVGINGGRLAGLEYRLALALGATVGVFEHSGRAVAELLEDPVWNQAPGLARLFDDAEMLEMFVNHGAEPTHGVALDADAVEALARASHEKYRLDNRSKRDYVHDSMLPWDQPVEGGRAVPVLAPVYRESTLQQQRALGWILGTQGFAIVPTADRRPAVELGLVEVGNGKQIVAAKRRYAARVEAMARLEHARWNAERLGLGWRRGTERSLPRRTSPHLKPYDELDAGVRAFDAEPFLMLAQRLRALGGLKLVDLWDRPSAGA